MIDESRRTEGPSPTDGSSEPGQYETHLERSRTVWDRWSDYYTLSETDLEPIRETAIDGLALQSGDRVLECGCGPGVNFERIRTDIGEDGTLVAVDYSPDMVEKARNRVETHGWENVEVRCEDATTADFSEPFDAAIATLSLSVMPDIRRTVENVYENLAPGGSFVVFDLRTVPDGPARIVNPLLWRFLRWYANWNPRGDVIESLAGVFDECDLVETYAAGTGYIAHCRKRSDSTV